jgi:hypothetical protein
MGTQIVPIKTKIVIACTNRSREEVVSDNSTEALMQRFLFEKEVNWTSHGKEDYLGAFKCATGMQKDFLMESIATCCAEASKGEYKISPRTAGKALKSARLNGLESLRGMFGFNEAVESELKVQDSKRLDFEQEQMLKEAFKEILRDLLKASDLTSGIRAAEAVKRAALKSATLTLGIRDANVNAANDMIKHVKNSIHNTLSFIAKNRIVKPKVDSFAHNFQQRVLEQKFDEALDLVRV